MAFERAGEWMKIKRLADLFSPEGEREIIDITEKED